MNGVLVVDKPGGMTSHDVVARLRRLLKTREVGHAGTLDPMATGVLVIAIGEATKLVPYLTSEEKAYDAAITFGRATDTLDAEGTTTAEGSVPNDLAARLEDALVAERARTTQVPPAFSAIHVAGARAHELARRGESVELAPRPARALELTLRNLEGATAHVALRVSKGYYVRSFARDLGERVGCPAHLSALRRTASGSFTLADAALLDASALAARIVSIDDAAARVLPRVSLTARGVADARAGRVVDAANMQQSAAEPVLAAAWFAPSGELVAIGEVDASGRGRVLRGFRPRRMPT